jgi:heptosyltransferase-2
LRSLGDIVLETPAIAALHSWRPDLRICVLVEPWCAAALEGNPAVSEQILSRGFVETARELRRHKFPIVFNQHGGPRSALLTAASASPVRVCWEGFQFSFFYNVLVPDKKEFFGTSDAHTVEHRISQFYWTGLPRGPIPQTQVFPQADAVEAVTRVLNEKGIASGEPYAVLQPGARLTTMRWPAEKFAEIARWLRKSYGVASVVNLGRGDDELASVVRRALSDSAVIAESFDARELIALIVIFSSTNPSEWRPWQGEYRIVHTNAVFESRRGDKSVAVSEERTIASIGVDEVCTACEEMFAASAASQLSGKETLSTRNNRQ